MASCAGIANPALRGNLTFLSPDWQSRHTRYSGILKPEVRMQFRPVAMVILAATSLAASTNPEVFEKRIQPVLTKNCASCHSGGAPAGGLAVASLDSLLAGGKHGPAITPGDPAKSLMLQYIRGEKSPKMPLGGALAADSIDQLTAAVAEMTPLTQTSKSPNPYLDWLLHKPVAPPVPVVKDAANPIDAFVLQRLASQNLHPAAPADRRTLIRRVYFDLIGVPPSPDEVKAFVADPAPDAYARLVDKLLDDPRYGERWGRHWLDLVRFAESDGFAIDGERPTAWRYRDYVIRAFNQDKPYDVFVKEQLAGDETGRKRCENGRPLRAAGRAGLHAHGNVGSRRELQNPASSGFSQRRCDHHQPGVPGCNGRLRALPRSQIRSYSAARFLPPAGILRCHQAR